jgi:poly(3-hydroxyalkanoate) depolymerase
MQLHRLRLERNQDLGRPDHAPEGAVKAHSDPAVVRRMTVDGADVRVSVRGQGPPLLLFNGIGAALEMWDRLSLELTRRGRQLIAIDLPGAGSSPPLYPPPRISRLVRIAAGVLDRVDVEQADVLGVSFGGGVAQQFAHQAPERIRRLVLCATSTGALSVPARPSVLVHLATPLRYWNRSYARRVSGIIYGGRAREEDGRQDRVEARFSRPPSAVGYAGQLYAAAGWTSLPWVHTLAAPTLVMAGDDDPIIPVVNARILAHRIPRATLHLVEGGGHLFLLEHPASSAEVIDAFLG